MTIDTEGQGVFALMLECQDVELTQEGKDYFQTDKLQSTTVVEYRFGNSVTEWYIYTQK